MTFDPGSAQMWLAPVDMHTRCFPSSHRWFPAKVSLWLCASLFGALAHGRAGTSDVVTAANTLLTTSTVQTSPYALTVGVSTTYSLANDKKWTNLPGTPPDSNRNGPVIGGGPVSFNAYELSATVSSGQSVSPRTAALTLATAALSATGYNLFNEIRNADDVIRSSPTTATSEPWQYGDYHVATLGTPSTTSPWMLQFTGHHLAFNITYNGPYVSATPMFIGTEPPDYHSIGTDLTSTEKAVLVGTNTVGSTTYTGDFLVSYPYTTSPTTTYYRTATAAASITGGTAVSGATSTSYTVASSTAADNGFYYCVATNSSGSTSSNTVALTIAGTANSNIISSTASTGTSPSPIISTQPASQTVIAGTSVTFTIAASNATSYQWYKIAATHRAPLETQRTVVSSLAVALQADTTLTTSAKLSGTFSDVVLGVTNSGDGNFPFIGTTPTYPTGTTGRGVRLGSMTAAQQATFKPMMKAMIEAWVTTQASDISASLLADYESDTALADTYIGYQVGAGAADGGSTRCNFDATINQAKTPINSQNSYLRIDGPRCWIEMVVQAAVAYKSNGFVHYHSLWRDRLADYGNEFGGFLDTTSTSTTYTRPAFTTQPASVTGSSATFTAAATANAAGAAITPVYQWYNASGAISGATGASYTTTTAGSYYVTATTDYGTTASNTVTFTLVSVPSVTSQPTSQTVTLGNSASFTVAASGSGTLSYQWYQGAVGSGTAISGATASTYTINATSTSSAGTYYCVVTSAYGTATSAGATLTVTEPLANYLSTYGLTSYSADSDGDGISNLLEFVLGGDPTVPGTAILPTATRTVSGGTAYLVFSFYTVSNLGSLTTSVQYSTDLQTWTTAVNNTGGVTITTTAYSTGTNYTTVTIPSSSGGNLFARLVVTIPSTYSSSY